MTDLKTQEVGKMCYLAGKITGAPEFIKSVNLRLGEILNSLNITALNQDVVKCKNLQELQPKELYTRDKKWVKEADMFIANVSMASLGVGVELEFALQQKKPILLIYIDSETSYLSPFVVGMAEEHEQQIKLLRFEKKKYTDPEDVSEEIKSGIFNWLEKNVK